MTQTHERQTTRLYMLSMILAFVVLLSYTVATKEAQVHTIRNPSQQIYDKIYAEHSDTIECTCSGISIPYSTFIAVDASYHEICSSPLIFPYFFAQLAAIRTGVPYYQGDFMLMSVEYFQWFFTFCALAQRTISQQVLAFQAQLLVNNKLLTRNSFHDQASNIVDDFITNVRFIFSRGIGELRQMMGFAQPISATSGITYQLKIKTTGSGSQVQIVPADFFSGCSCLCNPTGCSKDGAFYAYNPLNNSLAPVFKIPGVRIGCSPMESVLQSNLACWYSSDCYNTVR